MKICQSRLLRRLLGLALAVCFVLCSSVTARADAVSTYTVSISPGQLSVLKNGYVTNTFRITGSSATVITGQGGDLMVCFNNTSGEYVGVTLGSQQIVNFYGSIDTLRLDSSLNRPVVIASTATVNNLVVDAPVKVSVWGKLKGGSVNAAATIVAAKGSTVSDLFFYSSRARFYPNEGSVIDGTTIRSSENMGAYRYGGEPTNNSSFSSSNSSSSSPTSSTVSGITLRTSSIYAIIGETLSDLEYQLEENVTARDVNGRRLYGEVEWVDRGSTRLLETKSYRYRFIPDDSGYDIVTGSIRVVVDDDDVYKDKITLDISGPIYTSYDNKRLSSYLTKLEARVEAYNENGKRVGGKVKWSNSSQKVTETGTYKFTFTPNNPMYRSVTGEIEIILEN